jgi:probable HAF family extracellular repeat protein
MGKRHLALLMACAFASVSPAFATTIGYSPPLYSITILPGVATAINNSGEVVGDAYFPSDPYQSDAYVYGNGSTLDLGTLAPSDSDGSAAIGVTNSGEVVFATSGKSGGTFEYSNGSLQMLGGLDGATAHAVNDSLQMTGELGVPNPATGYPLPHAFLYSNGSLMDLGTLGGSVAYSISFGNAINNLGQVTGLTTIETGSNGASYNGAFLYSNGTMRAIGTLGGQFSEGTAIIENSVSE